MLPQLIHFHRYITINTYLLLRYRTLSLHFDDFLVLNQAGCGDHGPVCRACCDTFSMSHYIYVELLLFKQRKRGKKKNRLWKPTKENR